MMIEADVFGGGKGEYTEFNSFSGDKITLGFQPTYLSYTVKTGLTHRTVTYDGTQTTSKYVYGVSGSYSEKTAFSYTGYGCPKAIVSDGFTIYETDVTEISGVAK